MSVRSRSPFPQLHACFAMARLGRAPMLPTPGQLSHLTATAAPCKCTSMDVGDGVGSLIRCRTDETADPIHRAGSGQAGIQSKSTTDRVGNRFEDLESTHRVDRENVRLRPGADVADTGRQCGDLWHLAASAPMAGVGLLGSAGMGYGYGVLYRQFRADRGPFGRSLYSKCPVPIVRVHGGTVQLLRAAHDPRHPC